MTVSSHLTEYVIRSMKFHQFKKLTLFDFLAKQLASLSPSDKKWIIDGFLENLFAKLEGWSTKLKKLKHRSYSEIISGHLINTKFEYS